MRSLDRLLRPRSIAVLGSGWAANVIEQIGKIDYRGRVWPVHPTRSTVGGLDAWPSLGDLPSPPDATFIGVNRHATIDVVSELSAMGAGGAICFAAGWGETGDRDLQTRLVEAAGDMPILGPNCYGVINYLDGVLLWPDQHGGRRVERGVALISQSSNIVVNLTMQARGLPVAYVACLGNAAHVGLADLSAALLEDDRVTALGLYVEGFGDAAAFAGLALAARAAGKGIVCLKSGKTVASQSAAASHTASLAGGGAASSAFLRQVGVAEVATLPELLETLKIFHVHGPGLGARLCSLSCSGGEAGMAADLGAMQGLAFPAPTPAQVARLGEVLGPLVAIANPLDYNTFIWGDGPKTTEVFATMLEGYDAGLFVIDPPRPDRCDPASYGPALAAISTAGRMTGKPAFAVASLPENFDEHRAIAMMAEGTVPMMGLDTALGALRAAQTPPGIPDWSPFPVALPTGAVLLDEAAAKAALAARGVAVPRSVSAATLGGLRASLPSIGVPFALKGLGFAHKTEAGAVRLGLDTLDCVAEMAGATGYLAEEMVTGAVAEVIVGLRRDAVYGITLTLGFGGVMAELLADTVTLVLPVTEAEVDAGLRGLRLWPLLDGYRGRARADVAALRSMVMVLADWIALDPTLEEVELNPVMVLPSGAVAVDALIRKGTP